MSARLDATPGDKHGRLVVLKEVEPYVSPCGTSFRRVACRCECGAITTTRLLQLRNGHTRSCGCLQKEHSARVARSRATHSMSHLAIYDTWKRMKKRCLNPQDPSFAYYGGRGITVCQRWLESFAAFFEDMGERPEGRSIDRIDNDGNYEPGNCRWATPKEQARNKRSSVTLTFQGKTMSVAAWAEAIGMNRSTLWSRLDSGCTALVALKRPVRAYH